MSLRRSLTAVVALALLAACQKVKQEPPPGEIVIAVFASPVIPTPNDLALQAAPTLVDPLAQAQRSLLQAFVAAGGFPSDQAVSLTIPFERLTFDEPSNAFVPATPASIDLSTVNASTFTVLKVDGGEVAPVAWELDPDNCTTSVDGATWSLSIRKTADPVSGSRAWAPGRYVFALRGGASGVRTTAGRTVAPDQAIALVIPNVNMTNPDNQPPGFPPAAAAQVEGVRAALWQPLDWGDADGLGYWTPAASGSITPAFRAVDGVFPYREVASIATFEIAPALPAAPVDPGSGIAPLPIDLLRTGPGGTIAYNSAFGAAADGLTTLDGFSTTAMILAPVTFPVDASTVHGGNVHVFKLGAGGPALLDELVHDGPATAKYLAQPPPIVVPQDQPIAPGLNCPLAGGCSVVIGLQPAVGAGGAYLPPLEEGTDYAVVITTGVKTIDGRPLAKSTTAKILVDPGFDAVATSSVAGTSLLSGVSDETATALQKMREQLAPVVESLPGGETAADVALAYTFRTQSVTSVSLGLSALPYSVEQAAAAAVFTPLAAAQIADVASDYGVPAGADVDSYWSVTVPTLDAIDTGTGALRPDLGSLTPAQMTGLVTPLPALVAVPAYGSVPSCGLAPPDDSLHCAKLVVFLHGLGGSRLQMLAVANELAAQGFVVAALDFPLHGDRAYCSTDADCNTGGTCVAIPGAAGQGDAVPPGTCSNGNALAGLTTVASGRYFISGNFFRVRDALRQNLIDQSALVLALARPPSPLAPQPGSNPFAEALAAKGIVVDPSAVYLEGISLGAISGTEVLATNPRLTRGVLSVGGGTLVDVFTSAPAFATQVDALFLSLGIDRSLLATDPAVAAAYLKTVNVAKWILDPGDPVNFAGHVVASPLPNLLSPTPALQGAKEAWGMLATNDAVVPNPFNLLLYENAGIPFSTYVSASAPGGSVPHAFLGTSPEAQQDAALWLLDPVNLPSTVVTLP